MYKHNRFLRTLSVLALSWVVALLLPMIAGAQTDNSSQATSTEAEHLIWSASALEPSAKAHAFEPGEILVGFYQDQVRAASVLAETNAQLVETLDLRDMAAPDSGRSIVGQRIRVPVGSEWDAIARFEQDTGVAFAMPNWRVVAAGANGTIPAVAIEQPFAVTDPLYTAEQWYLQHIQASRAWAAAFNVDGIGETPIKVAVIDSGIDIDHPEFAGIEVKLTSYINDSFGDEVLIDDYGHGTHVAGVIAASLNNGSGIAGLSPWVELDIRKVLNGFGNGNIFSVANAIMSAADNDARVINMSFQISFPVPVLEAAVKYASARGALLIGAGGNCDPLDTRVPCPPPVLWPAAYSQVMAVAATNHDGTRSVYSAIGPETEIAAPGGEVAAGTDRIQIYSTWALDAARLCSSSAGNYQLLDGGSYCNKAGTSMAAGIVSGLAALVWAVDPDLTSEDVRAILNLTADDIGLNPHQVGSGRINANAAVRHTIRPQVHVVQDALIHWLPVGTEPFSTTLTLTNPSSRAAGWEVELPAVDWLFFEESDSRSISGTVQHGAPAHLSLVISPTNLLTGTVSGTIAVDNRDIGEQVGVVLTELLMDIRLDEKFYLPVALGAASGGPIAAARSRHVTYNVAVADENGKTKVNLIDNSSVSLDIPFVFKLKGEQFSDLLLSSNGFVTFPSQNSRSSLPNLCPDASSWPQEAIYGWWADLDPGKSGARINHFQTEDGDFVVEFLNVPAADGVEPAYKVSFQMVLYTDGDIGLNYMDVPTWLGEPPRATIGVEAVNGQYGNRVFCADGFTELGILPESRQSFHLNAKDIF